MKKLIVLLFLATQQAYTSDVCTQEESKTNTDVVYNVNTSMPKYLKGATITVTQADGKTSTVPAEKFMVVPRKQQTVVGVSENTTKTVVCQGKRKRDPALSVIGEFRKDVTDITTTTSGPTTKVESNKELVPGVSVYGRDLLRISDKLGVGAGLGVDSNGTLNGKIGIDF
jgi:hypothetical protein